MPKRENYKKPLPYIKALAKLIAMIKEKKPGWDIFQTVNVAQRLIRRNKQWIQSTDSQKFMQANYTIGPGTSVGSIEIQINGSKAIVNGKSVNAHTIRISLYCWSF